MDGKGVCQVNISLPGNVLLLGLPLIATMHGQHMSLTGLTFPQIFLVCSLCAANLSSKTVLSVLVSTDWTAVCCIKATMVGAHTWEGNGSPKH